MIVVGTAGDGGGSIAGGGGDALIDGKIGENYQYVFGVQAGSRGQTKKAMIKDISCHAFIYDAMFV